MCISNIIIAFNFKEKKALTCAIVTLDSNKILDSDKNFQKFCSDTFQKKSLQEWVPNDSKWSETSRKRIVRMKIFLKKL